MITHHVNEPFNRRKEKKKISQRVIRPSIQLSTYDYSSMQAKFLKSRKQSQQPRKSAIFRKNRKQEMRIVILNRGHVTHPSMFYFPSFFPFLFFFIYFFFIFMHQRSNRRKEKKKLILVIAIQISFERTTLLSLHFHPVFLFSFFSRNLCSRSFLYNSVAFSFLLPLTIRGSP